MTDVFRLRLFVGPGGDAPAGEPGQDDFRIVPGFEGPALLAAYRVECDDALKGCADDQRAGREDRRVFRVASIEQLAPALLLAGAVSPGDFKLRHGCAVDLPIARVSGAALAAPFGPVLGRGTGQRKGAQGAYEKGPKHACLGRASRCSHMILSSGDLAAPVNCGRRWRRDHTRRRGRQPSPESGSDRITAHPRRRSA